MSTFVRQETYYIREDKGDNKSGIYLEKIKKNVAPGKDVQNRKLRIMGSSKKLLLIRHAKSDWNQPGLKDHERPLNEKGRRDASKMAKFLNELIKSPDLIVSSTARRAMETAFIMSEVMNYPPAEIQQLQSLYGTSVPVYEKEIKSLDDALKTVLIFGHNPVIEETVSSLCSGNQSHDIVHMKTCSVACLGMDNPWDKSGPGHWALRWFITPKTISSKQ